jgi:hypothetical protein
MAAFSRVQDRSELERDGPITCHRRVYSEKLILRLIAGAARLGSAELPKACLVERMG